MLLKVMPKKPKDLNMQIEYTRCVYQMIILTKKDIIAVNQQFDQGNLNNESSLDYALSHFKKNVVWTKQLAYLLRAIITDHVFEEGNKRTACAVLMFYVQDNGYKIEERRAVSIIKRIVLNNKISIKKIKEMIEDGISKN